MSDCNCATFSIHFMAKFDLWIHNYVLFFHEIIRKPTKFVPLINIETWKFMWIFVSFDVFFLIMYAVVSKRFSLLFHFHSQVLWMEKGWNKETAILYPFQRWAAVGLCCSIWLLDKYWRYCDVFSVSDILFNYQLVIICVLINKTGEVLYTFTILTTCPSKAFGWLHGEITTLLYI